MAVAGITEESLAGLVGLFYAKVRRDPALGPVFNGAIDDWPDHLEKLAAFWSSVMLTTGRYKGNPMAAHLKHGGRLTPEMFDRWLALWAKATADIVPPQIAGALQAKAARIAESLSLALFFRVGPTSPGGRV